MLAASLLLLNLKTQAVLLSHVFTIFLLNKIFNNSSLNGCGFHFFSDLQTRDVQTSKGSVVLVDKETCIRNLHKEAYNFSLLGAQQFNSWGRQAYPQGASELNNYNWGWNDFF